MRGVAEENGRLWQELERLRAMVGSPAVEQASFMEKMAAAAGLGRAATWGRNEGQQVWWPNGHSGVFERPGDERSGWRKMEPKVKVRLSEKRRLPRSRARQEPPWKLNGNLKHQELVELLVVDFLGLLEADFLEFREAVDFLVLLEVDFLVLLEVDFPMLLEVDFLVLLEVDFLVLGGGFPGAPGGGGFPGAPVLVLPEGDFWRRISWRSWRWPARRSWRTRVWWRS